MLNLNAWIAEEGNAEKYRKWLADPVTQVVIDGLKTECKPKLMPEDRVEGEMALHLHGQSIGEHNVLRRILSLGDSEVLPEEVEAEYNMRRYLKEQGYDDAQVNKMMDKINNGEI